MRRRSPPLPRYSQLYPDALATADELKDQRLKPGTPTPVALLEYTRPPHTTGICALYERAKAVPMTVEDVTPPTP
ncbi:hypothetical protein GCM10008955_30970 [Deinococcus malanensis]|uniref:Uncharacterized protein n=1 Tax=Deinococcus malanensis TaxID=1706855 RepID=A0ABQ2F077_9DEIO|nr:hypothetical protein [Deinococcus malanensis]GGK34823.1 hypothetical protein GCM10008955_30970 [Deinococcus malanensis]